jgi:hypothetical protein
MRVFVAIAASAAMFVVLAAGAPACMELTATPTDAGASAEDASLEGGNVTGSSCAIVGTSVLCRATSYCPGLVIDSAAFPDCGFRIRGAVVDLQCVCASEALCPIGTPVTCSEMQGLLQSQTESGVCTQISEGRCAMIMQDSHPSAGSPDCDMRCAAQCEGDIACRKTCGC